MEGAGKLALPTSLQVCAPCIRTQADCYPCRVSKVGSQQIRWDCCGPPRLERFVALRILGARQSPFEACRQSSNLTGPCQPSNLTDTCPDHYNFWAAARHGFVFGKESGRCVRRRICAIDRRIRMMTVTPRVRHIIVKSVYAMRLSCRGAVGKATTTDCKNDIVSSWLLFLGGYRIWLNLLLCVTCNTAIIGDEATGTRSRFVSCIQSHTGIAAAAAIASS
jgi:hypothetical protein